MSSTSICTTWTQGAPTKTWNINPKAEEKKDEANGHQDSKMEEEEGEV